MTLQPLVFDHPSNATESSETGLLLTRSLSVASNLSVSSLAPSVGIVAQQIPPSRFDSIDTVQDRLFGLGLQIAVFSHSTRYVGHVMATFEAMSPHIHSFLAPNFDASRWDAATRLYRDWLPPIKARLGSFLGLPANWDDEGAEPVGPQAVAAAIGLTSWFALSAIPAPDVFPTNEGGVLLEWHIYGLDAEIEVSVDGQAVEIFYQDLRTGVRWHKPLSPDSEELLQVHARLLRRNG